VAIRNIHALPPSLRIGSSVSVRRLRRRAIFFPSLPAKRVDINIFLAYYEYVEGLAEFAARRRQKNEIIFHRDMRVGKNSSQAASVEF